MAVFKKTFRKEQKPEEHKLNNLLLSQDESRIESFVKTKSGIDQCMVASTMRAFRHWNIQRNYSPLLAAIACNEDIIVHYLIQEGVDINSGDQHGVAPLALALQNKRYTIARSLIKSGADVNRFDDDGRAVMYHAIQEDSPVFIIQDLLLAGAPKDGVICKEHRNTPLTRAIEVKNIRVVKLLLRKSVDTNWTTVNFNNTPLNLAIYGRSLQMVKLLIKHGANVNGQSNEYIRPILLAAKTGDVGILRELTAAGAKFSVDMSGHETPTPAFIPASHSALYFVIIHCPIDSMKFFLSNKNIDISDIKIALLFSFTIDIHRLNKSEKLANRKLIQLLLADIDNINSLVSERPQLISTMIRTKNWIALEECIRSGLDVNTPVDKKRNCSVFQFLIIENISNLVELCLDFGADISVPLQGKMPYALAINTDNPAIIRAFLKHGHPFDEIPASLDLFSPAISAFFTLYVCHNEFFKSFPMIRSNDIDYYFVELAVEARSCSKEIKNPLHFCSAHGFTEILQCLLERRVPPASVDSTGQSPLHLAAKNGCSQACKLLLSHGACFNCLTPEGDTPLALARQGINQETITLLKNISICFRMVKRRDIRVIRILKTLSGNVETRSEFLSCINCVNRKGNTIMGEAIELNYLEIGKEIMCIRLAFC